MNMMIKSQLIWGDDGIKACILMEDDNSITKLLQM